MWVQPRFFASLRMTFGEEGDGKGGTVLLKQAESIQ